MQILKQSVADPVAHFLTAAPANNKLSGTYPSKIGPDRYNFATAAGLPKANRPAGYPAGQFFDFVKSSD
jgi:hypothetical protein